MSLSPVHRDFVLLGPNTGLSLQSEPLWDYVHNWSCPLQVSFFSWPLGYEAHEFPVSYLLAFSFIGWFLSVSSSLMSFSGIPTPYFPSVFFPSFFFLSFFWTLHSAYSGQCHGIGSNVCSLYYFVSVAQTCLFPLLYLQLSWVDSACSNLPFIFQWNFTSVIVFPVWRRVTVLFCCCFSELVVSRLDFHFVQMSLFMWTSLIALS